MDDAKRSEAPGGSWQAIGREWLDTLVVAISVAMCFRAYFYEPFNIPTGSMRPTLYGNYTEAAQPGSDGLFDLPVLSFFKFALTGETYKEFRAPWSGTVRVASRGDGCYDLLVANALHHPETNLKGVKALGRWLMGLVAENEYENHIGVAKIPTDAMDFRAADGARVNKGDLLWCGRVKKGDFIFVNRWLWNFRKPARGDVMIFSTTGISGLQQGTMSPTPTPCSPAPSTTLTSATRTSWIPPTLPSAAARTDRAPCPPSSAVSTTTGTRPICSPW